MPIMGQREELPNTASERSSGANEALWTVHQVAKHLAVRPEYIYRLVRQGLPCRRIGKQGYLRFRPDEVRQWVDSGR